MSPDTALPTALHHLMYVSKSAKRMSDPQLMRLVLQAQFTNAQLGITGILIYDEGIFTQVIEGEQATIDMLYAKICADKRHHSVELLEYHPISRREYPSWKMGYLNPKTNASLNVK